MYNFTTIFTIVVSSVIIGAALPWVYERVTRKAKQSEGVDYINPSELSEPVGYSHVTTASITNRSKFVCIAGQASLDPQKKNTVIGVDDITTQAYNSYKNLGIALAAAGAKPQHVLRSNIYTTANSADDISTIVNAREDFFRECKSAPPGALIGVPFLALEGLLVEVDADAIVSEDDLPFQRSFGIK